MHISKTIPTFASQNNDGAIAQLVEQRTENPCVPGSIPGGTTAKESYRNVALFCFIPPNPHLNYTPSGMISKFASIATSHHPFNIRHLYINPTLHSILKVIFDAFQYIFYIFALFRIKSNT